MAKRGIEFGEFGMAVNQPDADTCDLWSYVAFNALRRARRERPLN